MKKAILTFGLFTMMLVLTSFSTPEKSSNISAAITQASYDQGGNGQQVPKQPKGLEYNADQGGNGQQVPKQPKGLEYNDQGGNGQQVPKQPRPLD